MYLLTDFQYIINYLLLLLLSLLLLLLLFSFYVSYRKWMNWKIHSLKVHVCFLCFCWECSWSRLLSPDEKVQKIQSTLYFALTDLHFTLAEFLNFLLRTFPVSERSLVRTPFQDWLLNWLFFSICCSGILVFFVYSFLFLT